MHLYRLANILSLDVAIGAIASCYFFSTLFNEPIPPLEYVVLALAVWLLYSVDHLVDARTIKGTASTDRHRFYQVHFRRLAFVTSVTSALLLVLLVGVRSEVVKAGMILSIGIVPYLLFHVRLVALKEMIGALLYTAGTLLPAIVSHHYEFELFQMLATVAFLLTAYFNLILFAWFDLETDRKDNLPSISWSMPGKRLYAVILAVGVCAVTVSAVLALVSDHPHYKVLLLMNILLTAIAIFPVYFRVNDRFRLLGDAVFVLPALLSIL